MLSLDEPIVLSALSDISSDDSDMLLSLSEANLSTSAWICLKIGIEVLSELLVI